MRSMLGGLWAICCHQRELPVGPCGELSGLAASRDSCPPVDVPASPQCLPAHRPAHHISQEAPLFWHLQREDEQDRSYKHISFWMKRAHPPPTTGKTLISNRSYAMRRRSVPVFQGKSTITAFRAAWKWRATLT